MWVLRGGALSDIQDTYDAGSLRATRTQFNFDIQRLIRLTPSPSVYFSDDNWGLGLAIAANLHVPYRIEIRRTIRDLHSKDKPGKGEYRICWCLVNLQ